MAGEDQSGSGDAPVPGVLVQSMGRPPAGLWVSSFIICAKHLQLDSYALHGITPLSFFKETNTRKSIHKACKQFLTCS